MPRVAAPPPDGSRPRATLRTPAKPPRPVPGRSKGRRPGWVAIAWRKQWRHAGLALLVVVIVVAGALAIRRLQPVAHFAAWRDGLAATVSPKVRRIVIKGRSKTPEPALRAALGVNRGDNLLAVSLGDARARIEALAWVENATVERRLPDSIVVTLQERRPFAVWQSGGKFTLIDRAGQPVAKQDPDKDASAFAALPLVVGPGAPAAAAALLDALGAHPEIRNRVVAAVRVGERRWNLRLGNGADVLLPEVAEAAALSKLAQIQASQQLLERPLKTLDMRLGDRLTVRPQTEGVSPATSHATSKRPT